MKKTILVSLFIIIGLNGFSQLTKLADKKPAKNPCTTMLGDLMFQGVDTTPGRNVADNYKAWENGEVILVKFMNNIGSTSIRNRVMQYAKEWEKYGNITLKFVPDNTPTTNIRVRLGSSLDSLGHNSAVGTDCNKASQFKQTMNLDTSDFFDYAYYENDLKTGGAFYQHLLKSGVDLKNYTWPQFYRDILFYPAPIRYIEKPFRGTTLHEFGHALGLMHEQSYPGAIKWNRDTIYKYYARYGWDKGKVDHNVLRVNDQFFTNGTAYDPKSIMHYAVYSWQTLDGSYVEELNELSAGDKAIMAALYPKDKKISQLAVPKVTISNFTKLDVVNDKTRKALVIYPYFDVKTGAKLANAFYVARLTTEDGSYYIPTTNKSFHWGGNAGVFLKMNLLPNLKKSYNKLPKKDLQLIFPYDQMPDLQGKKFKVEFTVYQDDAATGKLNRLVYYSYSAPLSIVK